jgi:hypothetical protein
MRLVLAAVLAGALLAPTAAHAQVPAGNLLANPGAEAGPGDQGTGEIQPPSWSVLGNLDVVAYGAPDFPTAADAAGIGGGANFFAGGEQQTSQGVQTVDVSAAAAQIDAGQVIATLSADLGGFASQTDSVTITAQELDGAGSSTGSFSIGPVTAEDRADVTKLLPRTGSNLVPKGTRQIQVQMTMTRDDGSYNDGYADNVSLSLSTGKAVAATAVSGSVLVQRPGSRTFVALTGAQAIPLGATIDTRHGVVQLADKTGKVAKFYDGLFKLGQSAATTTLTLTEKLAPCGKSSAAAVAAAKKPKTRKLWGDGAGAFSTRGQYSAATVRGTTWLVQDSCSGTLTHVKTGVVAVRDNVKKKTIVVRAGKSYTARPRR